MQEVITLFNTCPLCGNQYTEPPALSRIDNSTLICPECGTRQALESIGISSEERDKIVNIINEYKSK